jgi:hypothetical protein
MGRRKQPVVKDHRVAFRVSAEELFRLTAKASRAGTTVGGFARGKALAGIVRKKAEPGLAADSPFDTASLQEIRRIGVNLNQMMKHCHTFQEPPPEDLRPLLADVRRVLNTALRLTKG